MRIRSIFMTILVLPALITVASAQTSVSASIYGAFSGTTSGDGTQQSPSNQAGGLLEIRHIANPILGFEGTYSFNRADQTYVTKPDGCPAFGCSISTESVANNAHEVTADWIPSLHIANVRPFGVLGERVRGGKNLRHVRGGVEIAAVLEAQADVRDQTPVQAGSIDVDGPGGGLRGAGGGDDTAEPMIGIYFHL
jgi:hypothetical protein